jgi:MoaA/NifB/PqqE/SkfB family radical SAM enzyme
MSPILFSHGWCGQCSIRDICGGCRARALTYFGDLFGPDPNCFRAKTKELQRNRVELNRFGGEVRASGI